MKNQIFILALLLVAVLGKYDLSTWEIKQSQDGQNFWKGKLSTLKGHCRWKIHKNNSLQIFLYEHIDNDDVSLEMRILMEKYFNVETQQIQTVIETLKIKYCYWNGSSDCKYLGKFNTHVYLSNETVIVEEPSGEQIIISLSYQNMSWILKVVIFMYFIVKIYFMTMWIRSERSKPKLICLPIISALLMWQHWTTCSIIIIIGNFRQFWQYVPISFVSGCGIGLALCSLQIPYRDCRRQDVIMVFFFGQNTKLKNHEKILQTTYYIIIAIGSIGIPISQLFVPQQTIQKSVIILYSLIPILQIWFNIIYNTPSLFPIWRLLMYLSNFPLIIYSFGCPTNYMRNKLNYSIIIFLLFFSAIQIIVIKVLQKKVVIFIYKIIYFIRILVTQAFQKQKINQQINQICSVCLYPMNKIPIISFQRANRNRPKRQTLAITPCQHLFHTDCLLKWIEVHPICPLDMKSLPHYN